MPGAATRTEYAATVEKPKQSSQELNTIMAQTIEQARGELSDLLKAQQQAVSLG